MGRMKKHAGPDEAPGAPEWMVTFSDCMTLLLTFFVLLLSFSSFDNKVYQKVRIIFGGGQPSVNPRIRKDRDAFLPTEQIVPTAEPDGGSEKPTLSSGVGDNLKEDTEPADYRSRKVFLISSEKVFWGQGTVISSEGRRILSAMASFLREVPGRIVVSEGGPDGRGGIEQFGLLRAWTAMEYLTARRGLDKRRFNISASSTVPQQGYKSGEPGQPRAEAERTLEIVLLERSIYN
jgi:chemotaxis protein MotB